MYAISLGFDNKVINGGEKVHFTLRLKPNPPNPSSFYASPEPTLPWPTLPQSHSCLSLSASPLPLSVPDRRARKQSHTPMHMNYIIKKNQKGASAVILNYT